MKNVNVECIFDFDDKLKLPTSYTVISISFNNTYCFTNFDFDQ